MARKNLKLKEIWTIRVRLQMAGDARGLALFNLAIDSKLRGCDLVKLRVSDVTHGNRVMPSTGTPWSGPGLPDAGKRRYWGPTRRR